MSRSHDDTLRMVYAAYNRRDSACLLTLVADDVDWPNGLDRLHGRPALREYWEEQWSRIRTHDEPERIETIGSDARVIHIAQVVRSPDGAILSTGRFAHTYRFRDGLIVRMDITPLS